MITKIPAKLQNGVITPLGKIAENPKKIFIYLEYENNKDIVKKIDLEKITGIIKKDYKEEYKKELFNKYN